MDEIYSEHLALVLDSLTRMVAPGVDSLLFAVARFTTAVVALAPFCIRQIGQMNPDTIRGAAICGSWVAFGYLGQLIGLLTTTASRSCVICSLHCVFVAAIAEFGRSQIKQSFDWTRLAPAAVAVAGVALVELQGAGGAPSIGDLLSFAQPIGFGMGYLQLEELMRKDPGAALPVSAIKLFMVACASLFFFEVQPLLRGDMPSLPDFGPILASPVALAGVLYTGLITTALALFAESIAFRRVPATDASIILTMEPLIAASLAAVFVGETFGTSDFVGAALIIGACVLAVVNGQGEKISESSS
jgi:drug/metabolite transporter (DMT)-like permease